jgi:hypothetical protein
VTLIATRHRPWPSQSRADWASAPFVVRIAAAAVASTVFTIIVNPLADRRRAGRGHAGEA